MCRENIIFTSRHWVRTKKTQRSVVTYRARDGMKNFGEILFFASNNENFAVIENFPTEAAIFSEFFRKLRAERYRQLTYSTMKYDFIRKMIPDANREILVVPFEFVLGPAAIVGPYCIDYNLALYSE
jgi:hypothetical protein